MSLFDRFAAVHNGRVADQHASRAKAAQQASQGNLEELAGQVAIKNAALKELKKIDPNNWLLKQAARNRIYDEGELHFRKTGEFPSSPDVD